MRSSTSRRDRCGARRRLGCVVLFVTGSLVGTAHTGPGAEAATWTPRARIEWNGGVESDLILDPTLDTSVVEGGPFAEVTPRLELAGDFASSRLRLVAGGSVERFFNSDARWLSSQFLRGDLGGRAFDRWQWRLSAGQNFFDDSQRDTVRRLGGWMEMAGGPQFERAALELAASFGGRRYPDLTTPDELGVLGTYGDQSHAWRATLYLEPGRVWLRASSERSETSARDPLYDAATWLHTLDVGVSLSRAWDVQASTMLQHRAFDERIPRENDDYLLANATLTWRLQPGLALVGQAGFYRYTWPTGGNDDSYRVLAGLRWSWNDAPRLERLRLPEGPPDARSTNGSTRFGIQAPGATAVSVVGSFDDWDATAHPLRATKSGWWETNIVLAPGEYQYGYVVDGVFTTPPEAEITVDDGFGGRNGWIEILP